MRSLSFLMLLLGCFTTVSAQNILQRSDSSFTQLDQRLAVGMSLYVPYGTSPSLNGGLGRLGALFYNTSNGQLYSFGYNGLWEYLLNKRKADSLYAPLSAGASYIQNQSAGAQPGSFYINGTGSFGTGPALSTSGQKPFLDVRADISGGKLGSVLGRLPEGSSNGDGTFLGVRGYSTQVVSGVPQKSFGLEHSFWGYTNNSINFHRGEYQTGGFMTFNTNNNTERMRIAGTGNVLINSTADDNINKLQVNGSLKAVGTVESNGLKLNTSPVTSTGEFEVLTRNKVTGAIEKTAFPAYTNENGQLQINEENLVHKTNDEIIAGTKNFTGSVSLGTAAPRAKLDVSGELTNGQYGTVMGRLPEGNASGSGTFLGVKGYSTSGLNVKSFGLEHGFYGYINNAINFYRGAGMTGGFMTFHTNMNEEKMRINASGNVLINTTTDDNTNKVQVNGAVKALGMETNVLLIKNQPVLSSGEFEVLTRNKTTGAVERTSFPAYMNESGQLQINEDNIVHRSNNEVIDGVKNFIGSVSVGSAPPRAKLDVSTEIGGGQLASALARLSEGNTVGDGTFLGVKGYSTSGTNVKSFSLEHSFWGQTNNAINFYRGTAQVGGFMAFSTNANDERMRIGANGNILILFRMITTINSR